MLYTSTRSKKGIPAPQAILEGISGEGGLYVPCEMPHVSLGGVAQLLEMDYPARAANILSLFLTDFKPEEILAMCKQAYGADRFDDPLIAPLLPVGDSFVLELFHGPTQAFKDMALQILPHFMRASMKKTGTEKETVILVATSGDTGKAALEGFRDVPGTRVVVFYPDGGVSLAQRMQMVTQQGLNVHVAAVKGNFDDAQTGVKRIFADRDFAQELFGMGKALSSANSINFGRLCPQIAYYFSAYADLIKAGRVTLGQKVNFCVPTGNFGNILAADYARRMGLPVGRLICASNSNNVLTDFIQTGTYDAKRSFYRTMSPSMDILVSSNVERLLFELCGRDEQAVACLMAQLAQSGNYSLSADAVETLSSLFYGAFATEEETRAQIKRAFDETGYLLDPHTAVGFAVYERYKEETGDKTPTVITATASPYKFARDVLRAICGENAYCCDEFAAADCLESFTGRKMPPALKALRKLPVLHETVCEKADMKETVRAFLTGKAGGAL